MGAGRDEYESVRIFAADSTVVGWMRRAADRSAPSRWIA